MKLAKIKEVLKSTTSWDGSLLSSLGVGQTEFRVIVYNLVPGARTTIHTHPMNAAGYMITGELTMYATEDPHGSFEDLERVKKIRLKPGDAWVETVNMWHYGINEGNEESEFVLIFVGHKDLPTTLSLNTHPK